MQHRIQVVDNLTKEQRSYTMSRIRSKDTKIEIRLRKALFAKGYRYRIHYKKLPGKPDIVFPRKKVAVFINGDFWHGWNFKQSKKKLKGYWIQKIEKNMERDKKNHDLIEKMGWNVVVVWEHEIKKSIDECVLLIGKILEEAGNED